MREHVLVPALVSALTQPVPFGADGERERDADFEEKIVK
jgi:hsp70-interacting protein